MKTIPSHLSALRSTVKGLVPSKVGVPLPSLPFASRPRPEGTSAPLRAEVGALTRWGTLTAAGFMLVSAAWATTAPLSGAVIASGIVSPESVRHTIQHLEGGIIRDILVREGQRVEVGDELVVLDDLAARADLAQVQTRLNLVKSELARLEVERTGASEMPITTTKSSDTDRAIADENQLARFQTRLGNTLIQKDIIRQKVAQTQAMLEGYETQLTAIRRQQALLKTEADVAEVMVKKGLEKLPRLLGLQRAQAERQAAEGDLMARSAQARESLIELKYQLDAVDLKRRDEVDQQIAETHTKLVEAEEALVKASDRLQRTVIRSPVRGTVLNVRFKTARGVVRNGETIMDLVPLGDKLIINANVEPKNIDEVRIGQDAHVVFPSYSQRALHRIEAKVIDISADALHDEKNNTRHYLARVEVGREHMAKVAPQIELQAGLPVEVYIATSERTLMEYLLQPLRFVIERSMRES